MQRMWLKAALAWCLILCLAVVNGVFREAVLIPGLGKPWALMLSGVLLCMCIAGVSIWLVRYGRPITLRHGVGVGVGWLGATLLFELGLGRLVQHQSWETLWEAYTFKDGNLWSVVLLVTLVAPAVAARVFGKQCG